MAGYLGGWANGLTILKAAVGRHLDRTVSLRRRRRGCWPLGSLSIMGPWTERPRLRALNPRRQWATLAVENNGRGFPSTHAFGLNGRFGCSCEWLPLTEEILRGLEYLDLVKN